MFGFGIMLMHLADYLTRRKYNKNRRENEREAEAKQLT
jgi:hypothetical protein